MKMKLAVTLFLVLGIFINASGAFAVPSISSITGNVGNGNSITISGSVFGANIAVGTSDLQWLGDNIENSIDGAVFKKTGWRNKTDKETYDEAVPRYSSVQAHSGSKSILLDYDKTSVNRYKGHFSRDHGGSISKVYISFWVYSGAWRDAAPGGQPPQWKIWRIKDGSNLVGGSSTDPLNFTQNNFPTTGLIAGLKTTPSGNYFDCDDCPYEKREQYLSRNVMPGPNAIENRWVRMEYYFDVGTRGNNDGTLLYSFHDPHAGTPVIRKPANLNFNGNLKFLESGYSSYWHNMFFGAAAVDGMEIKVYFDDVFMQVGTRARVEIGDASTWGACTHREIQIPTAWSDSSITINAQQGSFANGDNAYLYVVDSNGNVSSGYPITFSGADTTPPNPPTGLTIQ